MSTPLPDRVFISYSHDGAGHRKRVLQLSETLRGGGLDCQIDQYHTNPSEGWPRWMERQISEATFVLVVCTATYKSRFDGHGAPTTGRGADWEGIQVIQQLYDSRSRNDKFVPVLFDGASEDDIPSRLRPYTYYRLMAGYDDLYRYLTKQPAVVPGPVGKRRVLPPNP